MPSDSLQDTIAQEEEREVSALFFIKVEKSAGLKKNVKNDKVMANINISETPTYTLLNIVSTCVSNEEPEAEQISQNNQKYLEVSGKICFINYEDKL